MAVEIIRGSMLVPVPSLCRRTMEKCRRSVGIGASLYDCYRLHLPRRFHSRSLSLLPPPVFAASPLAGFNIVSEHS